VHAEANFALLALEVGSCTFVIDCAHSMQTVEVWAPHNVI